MVPFQQGACNSGCRAAAEDVVKKMQSLVDSLVALKPWCEFTGSAKIFESYYLHDDLFNTLGRRYFNLYGGVLVNQEPAYIDTIRSMQAKCPGLASEIDSSSWCTDDFAAEITGEISQYHGSIFVDFMSLRNACNEMVNLFSLVLLSLSPISTFRIAEGNAYASVDG